VSTCKVVRLGKEDFEDEATLTNLARVIGQQPDEFAARFKHLVAGEASQRTD
jgi:hypothetical protein